MCWIYAQLIKSDDVFRWRCVSYSHRYRIQARYYYRRKQEEAQPKIRKSLLSLTSNRFLSASWPSVRAGDSVGRLLRVVIASRWCLARACWSKAGYFTRLDCASLDQRLHLTCIAKTVAMVRFIENILRRMFTKSPSARLVVHRHQATDASMARPSTDVAIVPQKSIAYRGCRICGTVGVFLAFMLTSRSL